MSLSEAECRALLPWYLNNTLVENERVAVEQQLQSSAPLREELQALKILRDSLPPQQEFPASQLGWRRLHKQIRATKKTVAVKKQVKFVALAAMLLLTIQVGLFAYLSHDKTSELQLLGDQPAELEANQRTVQLQIDSQAPWQDVVELVAALNGDVIQGPGAAGIIRVRFAPDDVMMDGQNATNVDTVLQWLRSQPIVKHATLE